MIHLLGSMTKHFASEIYARAATEVIQSHGGYAYHEDVAVERYDRDAKLLTVDEVMSEAQRMTMSRRLFELYRV